MNITKNIKVEELKMMENIYTEKKLNKLKAEKEVFKKIMTVYALWVANHGYVEFYTTKKEVISSYKKAKKSGLDTWKRYSNKESELKLFEAQAYEVQIFEDEYNKKYNLDILITQ